MRLSRASLLPLLIVAVALGNSTGAWDLAAVLAAIATALAVIGPRWELDRGRQIVMSALGASVGYAAVAIIYEPQVTFLREGWTRIAAALLIAAAARFLIIHPRGGFVPVTVLAYLSLLTAGAMRNPAHYAPLVVAFLAASLWAHGMSDRSQKTGTPWRRVAVGAGIVALAAVIGSTSTIGLRRLHTWIKLRGHASAFVFRPKVGFSDRITLGALDGLLDSDTIVLRVHGPRVDYLRGAVLDIYAAGQWERSDPAEIETAAVYDGTLTDEAAVEISSVGDRTDRFFLPLDARGLVTSPASVLVDAAGAVKRPKRGPSVARFVRGDRDRAVPSPPGPFDLVLPRRVRPDLESVATAWSGDAGDAVAKLDAIERHLATEFRYSRSFRRGPGIDPVLDFITRDKTGHCEYFATAMALVARAAGIPARLVTGYRVAEKSPFGYHVVRERNAHAWVEAFVAGQGWTVRDPTPATYLAQNTEHTAGYAASAIDAVRLAYDDFTDWLGERTVGQTAIAWTFGFLVLVWIVARGVRPRTQRPKPVPDDERPLAFLEQLLAALAKAGYRHRDDEPIERLAARIPDPRAANLLERYAALRYGDVGDPGSLADEVARYVQKSRQAGAAARAASSNRTNR